MPAPTASKNFSALTALATAPAAGDEFYIHDASEGTATNKPKRIAWSVIDAHLDTLFQPLAAVLTNTTASYTTAEETKLAGIETAADVTDTTNVTAAGALMDSEVDADIKTLALPANTTISAFGATVVDDADAAAARATLEAAALIGVAANTQTGTSYTGVIGDAGQMITMDNASANTFTIPANGSVAYAVGTELHISQLGAGATTVAITTDTLNVESSLTLVLAGQYAVATAKKITSTTWILFGNLTAS